MRLIDADELRKRITIDSDLVEVDDGVMVPCIDFAYNIDEAPTYNAIPMGWIKAYTRRAIKNADYWAIIRMVTAWEEEENEI